MGVEEPRAGNPFEHLLGRDESSFVDVKIETKKFEYSGLRIGQADIRGIGDVSVVVKQLTDGTSVDECEAPVPAYL